MNTATPDEAAPAQADRSLRTAGPANACHYVRSPDSQLLRGACPILISSVQQKASSEKPELAVGSLLESADRAVRALPGQPAKQSGAPGR
ncbi:hypothetical protein ACE3MS_24555 [Paenibacillus dendritiformis]|uniref:hypothetical protein n=1 Tax=Paenibacillus dendritiformis TaxID=130049 RepID=UPI0036679ECB